MSVILNPSELLAILEQARDPRARSLRALLETATNEIGAAVGEIVGATVKPCVYDPRANLGCGVLPLYRNQPFPAAFAAWSDGDEEEWADDAAAMPPAPPGAFAKRMAELSASRDSYVLGAPDGTETPDPQGWAREYPAEAEELDALETLAANGED